METHRCNCIKTVRAMRRVGSPTTGAIRRGAVRGKKRCFVFFTNVFCRPELSEIWQCLDSDASRLGNGLKRTSGKSKGPSHVGVLIVYRQCVYECVCMCLPVAVLCACVSVQCVCACVCHALPHGSERVQGDFFFTIYMYFFLFS